MQKLFLLLSIFFFLCGELSLEGEFVMYTTEVFSITIEDIATGDPFRTMAHAFSNIQETSGLPVEMGQFNVVIIDSTSRGSSNFVRIQSTVFDGTIMQIQNIDSVWNNTDADPIIIDLYVTDDKNTDGTNATPPRELVVNGILREITTGEGSINETHEITVNAAGDDFSDVAAGNYRTTLFFTLET